MEILEILSNSILVASGLIRSAASYTTTYTHAGAGVYDELLIRQILSGWRGWMMRRKGLPLVHLAHLLIFGCLPGQARTDDGGASDSLVVAWPQEGKHIFATLLPFGLRF